MESAYWFGYDILDRIRISEVITDRIKDRTRYVHSSPTVPFAGAIRHVHEMIRLIDG